MRVMVILNPFCDGGRGVQQQALIEETARPYGGVELMLTHRRGHARDLAREAATGGYDIVAAAGGDGTVHEVVNGLIEGNPDHCCLGVVPVGSGNDFAFASGVPLDTRAAVVRLFEGQPHTVDLARVEDDRGRQEIFENNLGVGLDANVVIRTAAISQLRGFLMYFWGVLQTLAKDYIAYPLEMRFDGEVVSQDALFVAMGLGPRHGGGFMLTPDASQTDNLVDSCTADAIPRTTAIRLLNAAVRGTHVKSQHITMRQNREIEIRSTVPLPIHIDGEVFAYPEDKVHRVTITTLPAALRVIA